MEDHRALAREIAAFLRTRYPNATVVERIADWAHVPSVICEIDRDRHHIRFLDVQGREHDVLDTAGAKPPTS